jgi:DNA-binding transcriptional MerR regulator
MSDGLLPIGMFSRASSLSIKTLRAYHESGILVPAQIDPSSGYRLYTADQLADASVISRLRALDLPLREVREVLRARDPDRTRSILAQHRSTMESRLAETERIVAELHSGLAPTTHTPVHVRFEEAAHTLRVTGSLSGSELWPWLESAFARMEAFLASSGVAAAGPFGALYEPELTEDDIEHAEAILPVADPLALMLPTADMAVGELPATWAAVLVHTGSFESIGDTYRSLGAWVARHAVPSGGRIRERYTVGPSDAADPDAYRTEISWPIATPPGPLATS